MELIDLFSTAMAERQLELAVLSPWVRSWIVFMRLWFFSGLVFVVWWTPPRLIVLTMLLTGLLILTSKIVWPGFDTILAGTIIQAVLWLPLLVWLLAGLKGNEKPRIKTGSLISRIYGIWLIGATLLIAASTTMNIYALGRELFA